MLAVRKRDIMGNKEPVKSIFDAKLFSVIIAIAIIDIVLFYTVI